jgi:peptidoglycan/LPS O-acetylase OafA/YrhL
MGRYLPQLDGLRAVAVMLVIATHIGLIPGGYIGVDVFFVLSGFLITSILMREREDGRWSIRRFYVRRIRRLYPALLLMLLLTLPFERLLVPGSLPHRLIVVSLAATYLANFGNGAHTVWMGGLAHTWSLAVEEQFYLVWPMLLLWVRRYQRGWQLVVVLGVEMLVLLCFGPPLFDRMLVGRGGALLAGCALALWLPHRTVRRSGAVAAIGAIGLAVVVALAPVDASANAGVFSAAADVACVALVGGLVGGGMLCRWFSASPIVWLGKRSYGIYLWHLPILYAMTQGRSVPSLVEAAIGVGGSIVMAALSYSLVERRFRYPGRLGSRLSVPVQAAPVLAE